MDKYSQNPSERRTFSLVLGLPTLVSGMVVLCGGFILVFILGLLMGSGFDVESRLPAIAWMLPERVPGGPPLILAEDEKKAEEAKSAERGGSAPSAAGSGADALAAPAEPSEAAGQQASSPAGVMEQGELAYRATLKTGQRQPEAGRSVARDTAAEAERKKAEAEKSRKAEPAKEKKASGEQRFRYVYQAAAYKDKDSADRYTARLKSEGFHSRTEKSVENGVTWFRVLLDFTGTPDETDTLRAAMKTRGVPKILLKSKVPVQ